MIGFFRALKKEFGANWHICRDTGRVYFTIKVGENLFYKFHFSITEIRIGKDDILYDLHQLKKRNYKNYGQSII